MFSVAPTVRSHEIVKEKLNKCKREQDENITHIQI